MPVVVVPTAYRGPTKGDAEVIVSGDSVRACLLAVEEKYPGFLAQVLDADETVHRFVRVFLNQELLEDQVLETAVEDSDRIEILAAIAGG